MTLSATQTGVLKGIVAATAVTTVFLALAAFGPWSARIAGLDLVQRLPVAFGSVAVALLALLVCVGRLARHRFVTPEDIDGSGLTAGTDSARRLQAIVQNTLEQTVLAAGTWLAWAAVMPASTLAVVPAGCLLFLTGRLAFSIGYRHGAPARAFGFALTFYPTALMLACVMLRAVHVAVDHIV